MNVSSYVKGVLQASDFPEVTTNQNGTCSIDARRTCPSRAAVSKVPAISIDSVFAVAANDKMTEQESKSRRRNTVLDLLNEKFPVIRNGQPLAVGIHKEILARMPEMDPSQLRTAMRIHTASTRYLKELQTATTRFDLDGNTIGEVTDEQRGIASNTLLERFKNLAEQRRALERKEHDAQREREELQKRQEKLKQLVVRFNSR